MELPNQIRTAIEANLDDMIEWVALLNFFQEHQSELSLSQKLTLFTKCEDFRNFWNSDRAEEKQVYKNGKYETMTLHMKGLNIDKNSVNPNNIYTDKDLINHFQTISQPKQLTYNKKPTKDSGRENDFFVQGSALAI